MRRPKIFFKQMTINSDFQLLHFLVHFLSEEQKMVLVLFTCQIH